MIGSCRICGKICKYIGQHLRYSHKEISDEEYYNIFILNDVIPICSREGCNNVCKFYDLNRGYTNYCGNSCSAIVRMKNPAIKAKLISKFEDEDFARNYAEQSRKRALESGALKNLWNDPDFRARHIKRTSKLTTQRNNDPNSGLGFRNVWNNETSRARLESIAGKGKKGNHFSEKVFSGKIYFASSWEAKAYTILDLDPYVKNYKRGPQIEYVYNNKKTSYIVDILVTYISNRERLIEVKGDHTKFSSRNMIKYRIGCEFSKERGYLPFKVWDSKYLFPNKLLKKRNQRVEFAFKR